MNLPSAGSLLQDGRVTSLDDVIIAGTRLEWMDSKDESSVDVISAQLIADAGERKREGDVLRLLGVEPVP